MEEVKQEIKEEALNLKPGDADVKECVAASEVNESSASEEKHTEKEVIHYFQCESCGLKEAYSYFGNEPPFVKNYKLLENAYVIEDPFVPPKQGEFIILGSHCVKCQKKVCKDMNCSIYYDATYCIICAKNEKSRFPQNVQEKLNKIIASS